MSKIFEQDTKFLVLFLISCILIYTVNRNLLFYYLLLIFIGQIFSNIDLFSKIINVEGGK